jgi:hypothetical protein
MLAEAMLGRRGKGERLKAEERKKTVELYPLSFHA